jgi:Flp pilus assembly protein TadD
LSFHCILEKSGKVKFEFETHKNNRTYIISKDLELLSYFEKLIFTEDISFEIQSEDLWVCIGTQAQDSLKLRSMETDLETTRFGEVGYWIEESTTILDPAFGPPALNCPLELLSYLEISQGIFPNLIGKLFLDFPILNTHFHKNKGCYPGQEIISRILHQGKLARKAGMLKGHFKTGIIENKGVKAKILFTLKDPAGDEISIGMFPNDFPQKVHSFPFLHSKAQADKANSLYTDGLSHFHKQEWDKAIEFFMESKKTFANEENLEALAVSYERTKNYPQAVDCNKELAEYAPNSIMAHANLSRLYMLVGKIEKAEEEQEIARSLHFQNAANTSLPSNLESTQNKIKAAQKQKAEMFKKVLDFDPDDDTALFGLGKFYIQAKNYTDGIPLLQKCISISPKYSVAYAQLAKAYLALQNFADFEEISTQGLAIAKKNGDRVPEKHIELLIQQRNQLSGS